MMTSFCNKKVHPFLRLPNSKDNGTLLDFSGPRRNIFTACSIGGGNSSPKPTNYQMTPPAMGKKDPGGIGFLDEVGGSVDGLMSCTESLGFESSDERTVDEQIVGHLNNRDELPLFSRKSNIMAGANSRCWQRSNLTEKKEKKEFPPPLSSLSQDGKPNFFLRAVRKDGRLELTEVKLDRPETLRASRQDGRLRLHLVRDLEEEEETEHENEDFAVETEEHVNDEEEVSETDEENEEEEAAEWKFPMLGSGSGDGHRRCYGSGHGNNNHNHHHHHHDLHLWRQRCVTTR